MLGKRLRPWRVRFSRTRSNASSEYSIRGIGRYPIYLPCVSEHFGSPCTHLVHQCWHNHPTNIRPQFRLELEASLVIEKEIFCQSSPIVPEPLVHRILAHGGKPIANGVEYIVEVCPILLVPEFPTRLANLSAFAPAIVLENVSGFQQQLQMPSRWIKQHK